MVENYDDLHPVAFRKVGDVLANFLYDASAVVSTDERVGRNEHSHLVLKGVDRVQGGGNYLFGMIRVSVE